MRAPLLTLVLVLVGIISPVGAIHVTITDKYVAIEGVKVAKGSNVFISDKVVIDSTELGSPLQLVSGCPTVYADIFKALDTDSLLILCDRLPSDILAKVFNILDAKFVASIADKMNATKLYEVFNDENLSIQKGNEITFYMKNKDNILVGGRVGLLYDDFNDNRLTNRDPTVPTDAKKIYKYFRPEWEQITVSTILACWETENGSIECLTYDTVTVSDGKVIFSTNGGGIKTKVWIDGIVSPIVVKLNMGGDSLGNNSYYLLNPHSFCIFVYNKDTNHRCFWEYRSFEDKWCYSCVAILYSMPESSGWWLVKTYFVRGQTILEVSVNSTTYKYSVNEQPTQIGYFQLESTGSNYTRMVDFVSIG